MYMLKAFRPNFRELYNFPVHIVYQHSLLLQGTVQFSCTHCLPAFFTPSRDCTVFLYTLPTSILYSFKGLYSFSVHIVYQHSLLLQGTVQFSCTLCLTAFFTPSRDCTVFLYTLPTSILYSKVIIIILSYTQTFFSEPFM